MWTDRKQVQMILAAGKEFHQQVAERRALRQRPLPAAANPRSGYSPPDSLRKRFFTIGLGFWVAREVKGRAWGHTARICTWTRLTQKQMLFTHYLEVWGSKDHGTAGPVRRLPGGGGFDLSHTLHFCRFFVCIYAGTWSRIMILVVIIIISDIYGVLTTGHCSEENFTCF